MVLLQWPTVPTLVLLHTHLGLGAYGSDESSGSDSEREAAEEEGRDLVVARGRNASESDENDGDEGKEEEAATHRYVARACTAALHVAARCPPSCACLTPPNAHVSSFLLLLFRAPLLAMLVVYHRKGKVVRQTGMSLSLAACLPAPPGSRAKWKYIFWFAGFSTERFLLQKQTEPASQSKTVSLSHRLHH